MQGCKPGLNRWVPLGSERNVRSRFKRNASTDDQRHGARSPLGGRRYQSASRLLETSNWVHMKADHARAQDGPKQRSVSGNRQHRRHKVPEVPMLLQIMAMVDRLRKLAAFDPLRANTADLQDHRACCGSPGLA